MTLIILDSVTSTMDVAREMLKLGQVSILDGNHPEPGGVLALDQTAGRGQRGRTWYSAPGDSLCATFFVPLTDDVFREAGQIAILAGAAVAEAMEAKFGNAVPRNMCDVNTADVDETSSRFGLKWPNDVELSGKKLGGILIEIVPYSENAPVALIGVGINVGVTQFPPDLELTSTSLAIEGIFPESIPELGIGIRNSLDRCIVDQSKYGFAATMAKWRPYDRTAGRRFRTETESGTQIGTAVEVGPDGALVIRTDTGCLFSVLSASATTEIL